MLRVCHIAKIMHSEERQAGVAAASLQQCVATALLPFPSLPALASIQTQCMTASVLREKLLVIATVLMTLTSPFYTAVDETH